jgi:hypothetical protein
VVVVVEPLVLPTGADAEVGGKPTAAAADGVDAAAADAGDWGGGGTPSGTSKEHYRCSAAVEGGPTTPGRDGDLKGGSHQGWGWSEGGAHR